MIPIWQMMIGVCIGVIALILVRPQALTHEETNSRNSRKSEEPEIISSNPGDNCVICLEKMLNNTMTYLRCGHALHDACYAKSKPHGKCPICRKAL